jgi:hypothetical protein
MRLLRRMVCFFDMSLSFHPRGNSKLTTSLLLFALLINFFQYVKELFNPGYIAIPIINVPFILGTGDGGE